MSTIISLTFDLFLTFVAVNLWKAAENLFVCLRVAVLVTYHILMNWRLGNVLTN